MAAKTTFAYRPLSVDQVAAWADLYTAILVADADDDIMGEDDLADEFAYPHTDFARGSMAMYDGADMVGYCVLYPKGTADSVHEMLQAGGVHPDYRNQGIGSRLIEWSERAALENWAFHLGVKAFRPEYSLVAHLNGEPAGLVMAHEYEAYNKAKGVRDLYIPQVGTRWAARRRGIASALVTTTLAATRADGFDAATLDVDADSPTGALGLYERLGFVVRDTKIAHRKVLRA